MEEAQNVLQSFFTIGMAVNLEPLPFLYYSEPDAPSTSAVDPAAGDRSQHGALEPQLTTYSTQTLGMVLRVAQDPRTRAAAEAWAKLLRLLDAADADPHFTQLRRFFDARSEDTAEDRAEEAAEGRSASPTTPSASRLHRRLWMRRPSLPQMLQNMGVAEDEVSRTSRPTRRRFSMRARGQGDGRGDAHELWFLPAGRTREGEAPPEPRCVRFDVRLDLHSVQLAPPPARAAPAAPRPAPAPQSPAQRRYTDTTRGAAPARRGSFVQRLLDRGIRKSGSMRSAGAPGPAWMHGYADPQDPRYAEALDVDDEEDSRRGVDTESHGMGSDVAPPSDVFSSSDAGIASRVSTGSAAARSTATGAQVAAAPDLDRVEEYEPSGSSAGSAQASAWQPGEDFLTLLRTACSTGLPDQEMSSQRGWWSRGETDPLPTTLALAFALAFGWEGMMHFCYGPLSISAQEGVYGALGTVADMDMRAREKLDAVLQWRTKVQPEYGTAAEPAPQAPLDPDALDDLPAEPPAERFRAAGDDEEADSTHAVDAEAGSFPSRPSVATGARDEDAAGGREGEEHTAAPIARRSFIRTWRDWATLFASVFNWVSLYEKTRVHAGLVRELDCEASAPVRGAACRTPGVPAPSPSVEEDALNSEAGFRRLPGIPDALRDAPGGAEYNEYRWARHMLDESQLATSMTIGTAALQFVLHQLETARWVHQSAWELVYLDECIFQPTTVRTRFPPPGNVAIPPSKSYRPAPGERDRSNPCPCPDKHGAWHPLAWRSWLGTLCEGNIIVPAVAFQAWWTLIAVLNGADRSGRWYNLQVKADEESFADLTDMSSVYV